MLFTASNRLKVVATHGISNKIISHCVLSCRVDQKRCVSLSG